MAKKMKSTFDKFIESLSPEERKQYDEEYKELLLSELILATQEKDIISIEKLTKMIEMIKSPNSSIVSENTNCSCME